MRFFVVFFFMTASACPAAAGTASALASLLVKVVTPTGACHGILVGDKILSVAHCVDDSLKVDVVGGGWSSPAVRGIRAPDWDSGLPSDDIIVLELATPPKPDAAAAVTIDDHFRDDEWLFRMRLRELYGPRDVVLDRCKSLGYRTFFRADRIASACQSFKGMSGAPLVRFANGRAFLVGLHVGQLPGTTYPSISALIGPGAHGDVYRMLIEQGVVRRGGGGVRGLLPL